MYKDIKYFVRVNINETVPEWIWINVNQIKLIRTILDNDNKVKIKIYFDKNYFIVVDEDIDKFLERIPDTIEHLTFGNKVYS